MRRFAFGWIVLVLLTLLLCMLASTGLAEHEHEWKLERTLTEATCTKPGLGYYKCQCGEVARRAIRATGHKWSKWTVTKKATCGAEGRKRRTCYNCGYKQTKKIKPTGRHNYKWKIVLEPTCVKEGVRRKICSVCSHVDKQKIIKPTGKHEYGLWKFTKKPTCTEAGKVYHNCVVCGKKQSKHVDPKGHDWDEGVETKQAGYLEEGEILYTCKNDPAHTKTEIIPRKSVLKSLMDIVRNKQNADEETDELRIVQQPYGGRLVKGSFLRLSVEAEGGVKPYTYIWWRKRDEKGWGPVSVWRTVEVSEGNIYHADKGGFKYYCRVTDSAGNWVDSNVVSAGWFLYIIRQPEDASLDGKESVTLACRAAGGTPFEDGTYLYTWYSTDGTQLAVNSTGTVSVSAAGKYYCTVKDAEDGPISSVTVTVN